jgi:hypothetical protein
MHIYFTHVEDGLCDRRGAVRQPSFHQFPCYIKPKLWKDSAIFALAIALVREHWLKACTIVLMKPVSLYLY